MTRYVAMLRGVNVGSRKVAMADLRAVFATLGHKDVSTYIQSGNVVFTAPAAGRGNVARLIEERIAADLGLVVSVILRTSDELAQVIDTNPFLRRGLDLRSLHVTFLAASPDAALVHQLDIPPSPPDEFHLFDREVYLHCPNGYGRTMLNNAFWERRLSVPATTRNWNTVTTLLQLTRSQEP